MVFSPESDRVISLLAESLQPQQPALLQRAAIEALPALPALPGDRGIITLLDAVRSLSPELQSLAIDRLLASQTSTQKLLDRLESQAVPRATLDLTRQQALKTNPDAGIRERAKRLFLESTSEEVSGQLAALQIMNLTGGDREQGREVFLTHCAACHRLQGTGHAVGPDLAALTDKSKSDMLKAILNPNAAMDRRYVSDTALLHDGRIVNGILASESENSVLLREKGGAQRELLREDLEELVDSGKSLMPEGFGREISPEIMKHLLAFLNATDLGS